MPPTGPVNPQQGPPGPDDNGGHGFRDWDDDEVEDSVMNMSSEDGDGEVTPSILNDIDQNSVDNTAQADLSNAAQGVQSLNDAVAAQEAELCRACRAGRQQFDELVSEKETLESQFARLRVSHVRMQEEITVLRGQVNKLRDENEKLRRKLAPPEPPTPWTEAMQDYKNGKEDYNTVYILCCRQENMSKKPLSTHPDLVLVDEPLSDKDLRKAYKPATEGSSSASTSAVSAVTGQSSLWDVFEGVSSAVPRQISSIINPQTFLRQQPIGLLPAPLEHIPFKELPAVVQAKIFRILLVKNHLVHCLSRLDRANAPPSFPDKNRDRHSELPHRFHWTDRPCCISTAHKPNNALKVLLVCKRWLYLGIHAFYGGNTFAFSSLGELGKFFAGIGSARTARIRHVELFWHGSLMAKKETLITHDPHDRKVTEANPRIWKTNQRTLPLKQLLIALSLETLAIHIEEGDPKRMRRAYEMKYKNDFKTKYHEQDIMQQSVFGAMCNRTEFHANHRRCRSLRTCHGIDYIYQLRGIRWIRFYETQGVEARQLIRDYTFVEDINSVVTAKKNGKHELASMLHNLPQLNGLGDWEPTSADKKVVEDLFDVTSSKAYVESLKLAEGRADQHTFHGNAGDGGDGGDDSDNDDDDDDRNDDMDIGPIPDGPQPAISPISDVPQPATDPAPDVPQPATGAGDVHTSATVQTETGVENGSTPAFEYSGKYVPDSDSEDGEDDVYAADANTEDYGHGDSLSDMDEGTQALEYLNDPGDPMDTDPVTRAGAIDLTGDDDNDNATSMSQYVKTDPSDAGNPGPGSSHNGSDHSTSTGLFVRSHHSRHGGPLAVSVRSNGSHGGSSSRLQSPEEGLFVEQEHASPETAMTSPFTHDRRSPTIHFLSGLEAPRSPRNDPASPSSSHSVKSESHHSDCDGTSPVSPDPFAPNWNFGNISPNKRKQGGTSFNDAIKLSDGNDTDDDPDVIMVKRARSNK